MHSDKWIFIQSCIDCGFYPSKKQLDKMFPPFKPVYPDWNEKPEPEHKTRGGFGKGYDYN